MDCPECLASGLSLERVSSVDAGGCCDRWRVSYSSEMEEYRRPRERIRFHQRDDRAILSISSRLRTEALLGSLSAARISSSATHSSSLRGVLCEAALDHLVMCRSAWL